MEPRLLHEPDELVLPPARSRQGNVVLVCLHGSKLEKARRHRTDLVAHGLLFSRIARGISVSPGPSVARGQDQERGDRGLYGVG